MHVIHNYCSLLFQVHEVNINLINLKMKDIDFLDKNPQILYIGRDNPVRNIMGSKWGNPFTVREYGRAGALFKYKKYREKNETLYGELGELNNKTLACFCYPKPCRGEILINQKDHEKI